MRSSGFSRASCIGVALVLILLSTITLAARDGRDFAGSYGFTEVKEQGDMVQLTLHLRLFNNSDADIKGAVVVLKEDWAGVGLHGSFPTVKVWHKNRDVQMSQQFTISRREYEDWLRPPAQPNVMIIYQDPQGQTWQKPAQLAPRPAL
jgi:hypothetical protein